MNRGVLVPDKVLIDMFAEKLTGKGSEHGFVLDGFPRNLAQAQALDGLLDKIELPLTAVVNLQVPDALLSDRLVGRRTCKGCNAIYHVTTKPPTKDGICDGCGAQLAQRADDKEELVMQRLVTYREQTKPLIGYYNARQLLYTIDGTGQVERIFNDILQCLQAPASPVPS